jgi:hypothetical protein
VSLTCIAVGRCAIAFVRLSNGAIYSDKSYERVFVCDGGPMVPGNHVESPCSAATIGRLAASETADAICRPLDPTESCRQSVLYTDLIYVSLVVSN